MKCDPYLTSIHWADMFLIGFWSIVMLWSPFVLFYNVTISIGRLQKKNPYLYHGQLFGILKGGALNWKSKGMGTTLIRIPKAWGGGIPEGTDKSQWKHARTHSSVNDRRKQDTTWPASSQACARVHLQKKSDKTWHAHQALEPFNLMNFLSDQSFPTSTHAKRLQAKAKYALAAILNHRETAVMVHNVLLIK